MRHSLVAIPWEVFNPFCQCIVLPTGLGRSIGNLEIELGQEFSLAGRTAIEQLGCHKGFQAVVVGQDLDWVQGPLEFGDPLFEASDGRHEPFFIGLIVALR